MRAMNWNFSNRLGWVFLLVGIVLILLTSQGGAVNQMRSGQCMIKAKQLLHGFTTVVDYHPDSDGNTTYTTTYKTDAYAPYFEYVVRTADGRTYAASGYDGSDSYTSDLAAQQAIVDRYDVGQSYQCWYG